MLALCAERSEGAGAEDHVGGGDGDGHWGRGGPSSRLVVGYDGWLGAVEVSSVEIRRCVWGR